MLAAVERHAPAADALVSAAAISDYTVAASDEKLKSGEPRTLELEPTPKLIDSVREHHPDLAIVGFKLETAGGDDDALVAAARDRLERGDLAFVVANDADVMGRDDTRTLLVRADDVGEFSGSKDALGFRIADELAGELADERAD